MLSVLPIPGTDATKLIADLFEGSPSNRTTQFISCEGEIVIDREAPYCDLVRDVP